MSEPNAFELNGPRNGSIGLAAEGFWPLSGSAVSGYVKVCLTDNIWSIRQQNANTITKLDVTERA